MKKLSYGFTGYENLGTNIFCHTKSKFLFSLMLFFYSFIGFSIETGMNTSNFELEEFVIQQQEITGTVTDPNGIPLPGVTVVIVGTSNGAITNFDGNFSINAKEGDVLEFSYVGMETKRKNVGEKKTINVVLAQNASTLEEVVLVSYGSQLKREVTGAVQTIEMEGLQDAPVSQVSQQLQGRLAGVRIQQTTGKPGTGMSIRIRGQLSVSGGSDPLYVVDGFPITGDISTLNPAAIETITILKDAASTSLYGSRAANGVVLITTKNGVAGETNISFSAYYGTQKVPERLRLDMMNAVQFAQFKKEYYTDAGDPVPEIFQNPSQYEGKTNDWYGALLRTAPIQSYNLSITSNKKDHSVAVIAGVFDQQGVVINSDYRRYSLRLNTSFDVSNTVKLGFNVAPSYIIDNIPRTDGDRGTGILFNALHTWPIMPIYDENGELTYSNTLPSSTGNIYVYPNWVRSAKQLVNETKEVNLLSNAYIQYEPIEDLILKSTMNVEILNSKFFFFNPSTATSAMNVSIPTTAVSIRDNYRTFTWLNENLATYTKSFNDHNFELLGGFTQQKYSLERTRIEANNYADDRFPTIQGALNINRGGTLSDIQEWSLLSFLSRLSYNYKGKYLFTAAVRSDGSSRFGAENQWGTFPSVSAGWLISEENFLKDIPAISLAKIRASYGVTGNNNIGNYTQYALVNNTVNAAFGDGVFPGAAVTSLSNPNLGWETTTQFDIGLDLSLFDNRLQFVYDYYNKTTTNLLYSVQLPQESGFSNFNDNIGEIDFWGHEFSLIARPATGKFAWTINANISFNRNKVAALAEGIDRVYGTFHITKVGKPFGQFYGLIQDGFYDNEEELANSPQVPGRSAVGSIKFKDLNGDGIITYGGDNDDRTIMGSPFPDFTYGIVNTFNYGNFDLSIVGSGSYGNELLVRHLYSTANLDGVFNLVARVADRWRSEENPGAGIFGTTVGGGNVTGIERDWMSDHFLQDASYFTIKNITLGYTFDDINKFWESARVYASVQNAYVFTNYWGGSNPETSGGQSAEGDGGNLSQGVAISNYPVPRTFSLGLNMNF